MITMLDFAQSFSNSTWIFPSPIKEGPKSGYGLSKNLRQSLEKIEMPRTTPHNFRRTAATIISELGFNRLIVEKVLNHKDQTVGGGIYDRHSYDKEKRDALEVWENELENVLAGKGKVIDIKEAKR